MTFKNMNDLLKHIQKGVQTTLENEVADVVKEHMSEAVNTSVYETYEPLHYQRRYEHGGLSDKDNMQTIPLQNGIAVKNNTPLNGNGTKPPLDEIIVYGEGLQPFPRDFYSETAETLEKSGDHIKALKNGLKEKGYDVK